VIQGSGTTSGRETRRRRGLDYGRTAKPYADDVACIVFYKQLAVRPIYAALVCIKVT
jgi:hypothetical protein